MFFNREKIKRECLKKCQSLKELNALKNIINGIKEDEELPVAETVNPSKEDINYMQIRKQDYGFTN